MKVLPYGEDGAYLDLGVDDAPDRAARTLAASAALRAAFPGADVVCGAGVVAVFGANVDHVRAAMAVAEVAAGTAEVTGAAPGDRAAHVYTSTANMRTHEIDVLYDGPDLDDVAARTGLDRARIIDLHAGREHTVEVVGFLPGFAYMGPIDPRLVLPRRASPRPRVDPQSVAIAGAFTGIYPLASPGGWHLLGRSLGPRPFDPARPSPFLFAPGDRVRFRPAEIGRSPGADAEVYASAHPAYTSDPTDRAAPALVVTRPPGLATVQDAGRPGLLGRGMPPAGPLDPVLFSAANRAVDNPAGAAAVELLAGTVELRARGAVVLSVDGAPARTLRDGDDLRVTTSERAVRYIAIAGGVDVPVVIGARATLLGAALGGTGGRPLRRGDVLRAGALRTGAARADLDARTPLAPTMEPEPAHLTIDPGPHLDRFPPGALDVLVTTEWRLSRLTDRTGARLESGKVPRSGPDLAAPAPMCRGAVQVTTDGTPIVLGPDHPTTGGYPVLAVVRAESFGALAQKRPGDVVRLRLATT